MNPDTTFSITTAPRRDSRHWRQGQVTWEELVAMVTNPADKKACGNYVLGTFAHTTVEHEPGQPCTDLHRRKSAVTGRSALTLDVDHPTPDFLDTFMMVWGHAAIVHTTWNSTPDLPRYRIILPTDRTMAPDEYVMAAESVMAQFGHEQFDPGSSEAERYMFKPSAKTKSSYAFEVLEGGPASVADLLGNFEQDLSDKPMPKPHHRKRDPFAIEGVVGLFNRVYEDWDLLIEEYALPYTKVDDNRYQLEHASSQAGMGPVAGAEGLVYSHHANDPAYGRTCSAFDLVRLHWYGHLDEGAKPNTPVNRLQSHIEMLATAAADPRVVQAQALVEFGADAPPELAGNDDTASLGELLDDGNAWKIGLDREAKNNKVRDTIHNWDLIRDHDPALQVIKYNELTGAAEATGPLPWRTPTPASQLFTETDRWELVYYMERTYGLRPARPVMDSMVDIRASRHTFNPVRDHLQQLVWDGKPRLEECLPGVRPTEATRLIARKVMVAAVARMMEPGCKWDHTLVLYGEEGLGKSWWIEKMALGYAATLGPLDSKDTLLTMRRSWIVTSDEGHALRSSGHEEQKEFLTRNVDFIRAPYGRDTVEYKRHNVIWTTTNDREFLSREEGNRRFLVVECKDHVDFDALTPEYIDQVWAEAMELWRAGEPLYFEQGAQRDLMAAERENFMEEEALDGIVHEYLEESRVPSNWFDMSVTGRLRWLEDRADGFVPEGDMRINKVCSMQIWVEALGRRKGDHTRQDLLIITKALQRQPGWSKAPGKRQVRGYGSQVVYLREES